MKFAVIVFPGSNCDVDLMWAIKDIMGTEAEYVRHDADSLAGFDGVLLPGGFSYGDYLRCGAIARFQRSCQRSFVWQMKANRSLVPAMGFKF